MDDIAVRLVALNTRTRTAWAYGHNKLNYVGASFQGFPERERASRGVTPLDADNGTSSHAKDSEPEIRLSFSRPPRNISKGWVFGGDQNTCDIYCGEPQMVPFYNIGRQTFSITINKHANVILKHLRNTNRTQVKYGTQKAGDRKEFVWILFPMENEIVVTTANQLKFSVIVTDPRTQTTLHKTLLVQFMKGIRDSMPSIPLLPVDSGTTTADTSLASAPETCTCPFYYIHKDRPLGYGSFGGVFVVMDVSTGINYAGKRFYWGYDGSEPTILASQDHRNVLKYVSLSNDDGPLLVTEYVKGGNLARPWRVKDRPAWQTCEIIDILAQCVHGLISLHESPYPVIHKDIKPENILVMPDDHKPGPWIKLADFGLASEGTRCKVRMGTWLYAAPEAFSTEEECTSKIDVWSLGVVLMQLLLEGRLPAPENLPMQGPQWCKLLAEKATSNWEVYRNRDTNDPRLRKGTPSCGTRLWGMVSTMLTEDPKSRPSARECLEDVEQLCASSPRFLSEPAQGKLNQDPNQYPRKIASKSVCDGEDQQLLAQMDLDTGVEVAEALNDIESRTSKTPKQPQIDNPQPVGFGLVHGDFDKEEPADKEEQGSAATIKPRSHTKAPSAQSSRSQDSPKTHHGGPSASTITPRPPRRIASSEAEASDNRKKRQR